MLLSLRKYGTWEEKVGWLDSGSRFIICTMSHR